MKSGQMLLLGITILLVGTGLGTYLIHQSNRSKSSDRIQKLEDSLNLKNSELQLKTNKIESLTNDILGFSKKLDINTTEITKVSNELVKVSNSTNKITNQTLKVSEKLDDNTSNIASISKEISKISLETNQLAEIISNEQKEKGIIKLNVPKRNTYILNLGGNIVAVSREKLEEGYVIGFPMLGKIPVYLELVGNIMLVSAFIKDKEHNIILHMENGEWALNKANNFSINYDETALEIINKKGLITLQIQLTNNIFVFQGMIFKKKGVIIFTDKIASSYSYDRENFEEELFKEVIETPRIFKHFGENYLGQRLSNN